jgi:hypothetical protein
MQEPEYRMKRQTAKDFKDSDLGVFLVPGVGVQVSVRRLFFSETCQPAIARRAMAGHPTPIDDPI